MLVLQIKKLANEEDWSRVEKKIMSAPTEQQCRRVVFVLTLIFGLFLNYNSSYADVHHLSCDEALRVNPLDHYLVKGQERVTNAMIVAPHPGFVDTRKDGSIKRTGLELPLTLKAFVETQNGVRIQALKTPSVNNEHPAAAARLIPLTGVSTHLELDVEGETLTTQAYFNMPLITSPNKLDRNYLFSQKKGSQANDFSRSRWRNTYGRGHELKLSGPILRKAQYPTYGC